MYPTQEEVKITNKIKKLIPEPKGYFVIVKCGSCDSLTICFSHKQSKRLCSECNAPILYPSGGMGKLGEKCALKKIVRLIDKIY